MPGQHSTASPAPPQPAEQLSLRFFTLVDGYTRTPPDRALWRVLIDLAIGDRRTFQVGPRPVSAAAVWSVALTLYMRANTAGIIEGFSIPVIAADCRLTDRLVKAALSLLRGWRVVQKDQPSRRAPARWRMNLGGLDWRAVRACAKHASGGTMPPLSGGTMPPLKGYDQGYGVQLTDHPLSDSRRAAAEPAREAATAAARVTCEGCGRSWPASNGPWCKKCDRTVGEQPRRQVHDDDGGEDAGHFYGGIVGPSPCCSGFLRHHSNHANPVCDSCRQEYPEEAK